MTPLAAAVSPQTRSSRSKDRLLGLKSIHCCHVFIQRLPHSLAWLFFQYQATSVSSADLIPVVISTLIPILIPGLPWLFWAH